MDVGADGFDVGAAVGDEEGFKEVEEGFTDYPGSRGEGVEFGEDGETDVEDLLRVIGGEFGNRSFCGWRFSIGDGWWDRRWRFCYGCGGGL